MSEIKLPVVSPAEIVEEKTVYYLNNPYGQGKLTYRIGHDEDNNRIYTDWQTTYLTSVPIEMQYATEYLEAYIDLSSLGTTTKVKHITESDMTVAYRLTSVIKKDYKDPEVYLKAFVNAKTVNSGSRYTICIWEKTFNGIDWEEVPEFVQNTQGLIYLEVSDNTQVGTSLEGSSVKKKVKKFRKFNPSSQNDFIVDRPDCLKLNQVDAATYRFTLYALDNFDERLAFNSVNVNFLDDNSSHTNIGTDTIRAIKYVTNLQTEVSRGFTATYALTFTTPTSSALDLSKFSVKVICKDGTVYQSSDISELTTTLDVTTNKLKLSYQYYTKVKLQDTFYKSIPTLIKIYYDGKLFHTIREVFNVMYNGTGNIYIGDGANDMDKTSEGISEHKTAEGDYEYILNPTKIDLLKNILTEDFDTVGVYVDYLKLRYITIDLYTWITGKGEGQLGLPFTSKGTAGNAVPNLKITYNIGNYESKSLQYDLKNSQKNPLVTYTSVYDRIAGDAGSSTASVVEIYAKNDTLLFVSDSQYAIIFKEDNAGNKTIKELIKMERPALNYINYVYAKKATGMSQGLGEIYEECDVTDKDATDEEDIFEITSLLNYKEYTFTFGDDYDVATYEYGNSAKGDKLLYNKSILSYGEDSFKSNIFVSNVDSFDTPLFNVIDLSASNDSRINTLIPWRDYLIAATDSSIYLITKGDSGYYSKVVNTFIGISDKDSKTCRSILNGIIFKSHSKIYVLQPNYSSSVDSILNITEISEPIESYLYDDPNYDNFAFTTELAYYLFMPQSDKTIMLKYTYGSRIWTKFEYPVTLIDYEILSVDDIRLYTKEGYEYYFDKELKDVASGILTDDEINNIRYGDILTETVKELDSIELHPEYVTPIRYYLRSGQKTDNISTTKQFVETKLLLATLQEKDNFPMEVTINIDGSRHPLHWDTYTDGALWKTSINDVGVLNTNVSSDNADVFNVFRQMFLRYSGKGKSIEHILSGISYYNFKLYVLYYRYKTLNVKQ